ncbi:hypothetical protein VNO80_14905 [Phaseolus coccineus]|uniref:SANTA domain-containing protein n=1 Tax=Phaseolus coccineus TaxID=3886 RepID=A0AAN9MJ55_PHACN
MTETERTLVMAMADSTPIATPSNDTESSLFQLTVTLYDWWLIKAKNDFKGKRLAVAGVSSRKDEAMRVFVSAPIIKRYDEFSLETVDGRCVLLSGLINEQRTIENGFAPQVFNQFLFGFPPDWESYALDFSREESTIDTNLGSGGGKKRGARLHDIKVCLLKKHAASGGISKQPDNEENSTSVAFENCDVEVLGSPATPVQSQSRSEYSVEQIVKKSASRVSRTLSPKTEGCYKKKVGKPKGARNQSASAVKNSRLKDQRNLTEGSQPKISTVTPESSNFRTSRSGRMLLPPLEFWRNQIPIYDANHELKEIKDGSSLISPRVSSPSLSRIQFDGCIDHWVEYKQKFYY